VFFIMSAIVDYSSGVMRWFAKPLVRKKQV